MARTHNAAANRFHQDDGVVLGKGGEPIPTTPTRGVPTLTPHVTHMDDGELVAPPPRVEAPAPIEREYYSDRTTWGRNMDGFQALQLLDLMLGGISVTMTEEQFRTVKPDVKWHFKARPKKAEPEPVTE